jgi:hypothetical protein
MYCQKELPMLLYIYLRSTLIMVVDFEVLKVGGNIRWIRGCEWLLYVVLLML